MKNSREVDKLCKILYSIVLLKSFLEKKQSYKRLRKLSDGEEKSPDCLWWRQCGKRVFLIVLDSVEIDKNPDASDFQDVGCDTVGTCVRSGELHIPN